jgi:hypothetical protein
VLETPSSPTSNPASHSAGPFVIRRHLRLVLIAGGLILAGSALGFGIITWLSWGRPAIPSEITDAVPFPIYIPKHLPAGYKISTDSFKYTAQEGVFIFEATDTAGDRLVFTEQARLPTFDASKFTGRLLNPTTLKGTPYVTTVGKTNDQKTTLLSIDTGKTWVLATTQTNLSNQDLQTVARGSYKY